MARTLIGEVELRLRDSLTPGAKKAAEALRGVKGAADALGSTKRLDTLSSGLRDATAQAQALARAMAGAKWGQDFNNQLARMRVSPDEIARLRREFDALNKQMATASTADRRGAIATWKATALQAVNDIRSAERALTKEAIDAARQRAVAEKQQAREIAQEKARQARETAQQARQDARDAIQLARSKAREEARIERELAQAKAREVRETARSQARDEARAVRERLQAARETAREEARISREVASMRAQAARDRARADREAAREEARASRDAAAAQRAAHRDAREARMPFMRAAGSVASGIGMAVGVSSASSGISRGARFAMDATAEESSVRTQMRLAGMTPQEIAQVEQRAGELSQQYRTLNRSHLMQLGQSLRSATGDVPKAIQMMETFAQMSSVMQGVRGSHDPQRDLEQFGKALDVLGATTNVAEFQAAAHAALRAHAVERRDLPLSEYLTFARRSKGTAQQLVGGDFFGSYLPNLLQQAGGNSVGTAWHSLISQVIGGRGTSRSGQVRRDSGLADANGGVLDPALLAREPHQWARRYMVPALNREFARAGVLERTANGTVQQWRWGQEMTAAQTTAMMQFMSRAFSNGKAGEFFNILLGQSEQLEKAAQMYRSSPGANAARDLSARDLRSAATSVGAQSANLAAALLEPAIGPLTAALDNLARGISDLTASVRKQTPADRAASGNTGLAIGDGSPAGAIPSLWFPGGPLAAQPVPGVDKPGLVTRPQRPADRSASGNAALAIGDGSTAGAIASFWFPRSRTPVIANGSRSDGEGDPFVPKWVDPAPGPSFSDFGHAANSASSREPRRIWSRQRRAWITLPPNNPFSQRPTPLYTPVTDPAAMPSPEGFRDPRSAPEISQQSGAPVGYRTGGIDFEEQLRIATAKIDAHIQSSAAGVSSAYGQALVGGIESATPRFTAMLEMFRAQAATGVNIPINFTPTGSLPTGGAAPAAAPSPPGRALGGPVTAGRLYEVGENNRSEWFIPGANGSIIPNHASGGLGGRSQRINVALGGITINGGNASDIAEQIADQLKTALAGAFSDGDETWG